jgi:hypothetical protein
METGALHMEFSEASMRASQLLRFNAVENAAQCTGKSVGVTTLADVSAARQEEWSSVLSGNV